MVTELSNPQEFTPEKLSIRGEVTGWILTLVVLGTATVLRIYASDWANAALILATILILATASISFGNWMDRKTVIRLDHRGISFSNGVRRTALAWDEIQAIRVLPAQWGARQVQVIGETPRGKAHFEFRTLATVYYQGTERGRTGFADGDFILQTLLQMANMHPVPSDNPTYSYYARK
ncbi:MAG: hypothetical protein Fur0022_26400 [Anaerolineales bacterium]